MKYVVLAINLLCANNRMLLKLLSRTQRLAAAIRVHWEIRTSCVLYQEEMTLALSVQMKETLVRMPIAIVFFPD